MEAFEISVQVEEIEILVKANIADALAGMTKLRAELKKVLSAQLPNIQSQIGPARQLLDQYGNVITSGAAKAQTATQNAGDTIKRTAQTAKQAADTEKAALEAVAKEQERINALVKEHEAARIAEKAATVQTAFPYNKNNATTETDRFAARSVQSLDNTPMVDPSQMTAWQRFTAQYYAALDNVKAALNKVGLYGQESIGTVKKQTDAATTATKKYGDQVKATTRKSGSLFGNLGTIIKHALISVAVYQGVRWLFSTIKDGITNAINAPEIENLFRVAFGKAGDQAAAFAEKLRSTLGVDVYAAKQMLGTFQEIETSMGIGQKTATKMSESLTLLSNDIASLYNVDPEQASENLQSALTGQWRAVRKYGFTLSEATIQQTAYNHGLAKSGEELTEQQKVIARYLTLVDQSKNAQGDMQRTLGTVANQLRVLKQNFTAAGRSIGSAFIPFIQAAVPWLNAFMVVLQRVGVQLSKWTYSLFGLDYDAEMKKQQQDITTGLNAVTDAEDAAGDAAEEAGKKAKGSLADFDEIKVIQQPDSSASGAGAGSGGLDFDVPTLDVSQGKNPAEVLADRIQAAFAKIREAVQPTIDALKLFGASLEPLKTFVATGLSDFYNDLLVPLAKWTFGEGLPGLLQILMRFNLDVNWGAINKGLDDIWKALEPLAEHVGEGLLWFLDNVARPLGEWCMNTIVPKVLDIIATSLKIIGDTINIVKEPFVWLWNNFFWPLYKWEGQVVAANLTYVSDALHVLEDVLKGDFPQAAADAKKALEDLWNAIGTLFGQGGSALQFQALGDNVSESTKRAIGAFDAFYKAATKDLNQLDWSGATITADMASKIEKNVDAMADQTIAGFNRQRNDSIKNIQELTSTTGGLTKQEADDIIKNINTGYDGRIKTEQEGQTKIKKILDTASSEHRGLTQDESDQINKIKGQMYDDGVKALSKNQVEQQAIYDNMRVNHTATTAQEAADVVKNSKAATDKVIEDANRKYEGTVAAIVRERDETHTISSDQADKLIVAAKKTRDDTVSSAEDQHQKVVEEAKKQSGEHVNEVDWETGQVKSKWQAMWDNVKDTATTKWNEIMDFFTKELPKWWNENVAPWFTKEKWQEEFEHVKQAAAEKWDEIKKWWNNTAIVKWWNEDVAPWFTAKKWQDMMAGVKEGFKATFKNAVNGAIEIFNKFIRWINDRMHFEWDDIKVAGKTVVQGGSVQLFRIPSIPQLAQGAVLKRSTLFNGAEYAGAAQNPEIVTPQNVMRDTVTDANGPLVVEVLNAMSEMTDRLESAISRINMIMEIDGKQLDRHMRPIRQAEDQRIGKPLFDI